MSLKLSDGVPEWPRGWRLVLFILALLVTVGVIIPAFIMGVGYLAGFGKCVQPEKSASIICSPSGRILLLLLIVATGLPLGRAWSRFLANALAPQSAEARAGGSEAFDVFGRFSTPLSVNLPVWQSLSCGHFKLGGQMSRTILFEGTALTFWSLFALQKERLKPSDRAVIVYQRTPIKNLNLALAYWDRQTSAVYGVAARVQIASVLIAIACILIFAWLNPPFAGVWISLCSVLIVVSAVYVVLMMRAKNALRDFLDDPDSARWNSH